jgi:hypothetical protein
MNYIPTICVAFQLFHIPVFKYSMHCVFFSNRNVSTFQMMNKEMNDEERVSVECLVIPKEGDQDDQWNSVDCKPELIMGIDRIKNTSLFNLDRVFIDFLRIPADEGGESWTKLIRNLNELDLSN